MRDSTYLVDALLPQLQLGARKRLGLALFGKSRYILAMASFHTPIAITASSVSGLLLSGIALPGLLLRPAR